ncbi:MAG: hypothetical protein ABIV06_13240 [Thermoanaerobaculia bacterium]
MRPNRLPSLSLLTAGIVLSIFTSPSIVHGADPFIASALAVETYEYRRDLVAAPALDFVLSGTTDLTKDSCGTAESFAVPPGTDIRFCYFAGNPGSVTFSRHDLADSQGQIFTGFPLDLAPGYAVFLMQNRQPATSGGFAAQWTAYNPGPIDVVSASDSNPVTMTTALISCNGPTSTFSNGIPVGWTSYDWLALAALPDSEVDWADLSASTGCGEVTNYTGGRGGAACASSDLVAPQAYDTQLRSHSFSLAGETSARVEFLVNYQDFAGGDAFYVDYSVDGGTTWMNLAQSSGTDYGAFRALPGAAISIDLAVALGEPDVRLGWRYVNHDSNASDYYVQVDNIRLACGNGLFSDGFESGDTHAWSEGQE